MQRKKCNNLVFVGERRAALKVICDKGNVIIDLYIRPDVNIDNIGSTLSSRFDLCVTYSN